MELKELNNDLLNLKRDYDSCQLPQWNDESTKRTLNRVADAIKSKQMSWNKFHQFVEDNLGQSDFAWGCLQYVKQRL